MSCACVDSDAPKIKARVKTCFINDDGCRGLFYVWCMKKVLCFIISSLLFGLLGSVKCIAQDGYLKSIQQYRDSVNRAWMNQETTVLIEEDFKEFKGLDYFPIDTMYRVKAKFAKLENTTVVRLKTTGTRLPQYRPFGTLTFTLHGKDNVLTLYQFADPSKPELKHHLLLAFLDATNDEHTYMGGRYLDYDEREIQDEVIIDFNRAYNPYCAYNYKYSCVIPPAENRLNIPIEAGAKKFHD
jgi:uncharacterized protein (DUF1684 family)